MERRENLLRAVKFEYPESIPVQMFINNACWHAYPQNALQDLMAAHPILFPDFAYATGPVQPVYAPYRVAGIDHKDSWGCVWRTVEDGITGTVVKHALSSWDDFHDYVAPDPGTQNGWGRLDWQTEAHRIKIAECQGYVKQGSLRHGHTFLTMAYIRGFEAIIFDMVDQVPQLYKLIKMVEDFNFALVERYIALGVEWMNYPEDLGMQKGPLLSPALFQHYIKPTYQRLMEPARQAGCVIHMHSDGDIRTLVPDVLDCGVDVINLQDLVNGIEWIADNLKGKVCIDLDVDRQQVTRFGTPSDIDTLIRNAVETLGSAQGGLMLKYDVMPGLPLINIRALMDAMEKYASYYN